MAYRSAFRMDEFYRTNQVLTSTLEDCSLGCPVFDTVARKMNRPSVLQCASTLGEATDRRGHAMAAFSLPCLWTLAVDDGLGPFGMLAVALLAMASVVSAALRTPRCEQYRRDTRTHRAAGSTAPSGRLVSAPSPSMPATLRITAQTLEASRIAHAPPALAPARAHEHARAPASVQEATAEMADSGSCAAPLPSQLLPRPQPPAEPAPAMPAPVTAASRLRPDSVPFDMEPFFVHSKCRLAICGLCSNGCSTEDVARQLSTAHPGSVFAGVADKIEEAVRLARDNISISPLEAVYNTAAFDVAAQVALGPGEAAPLQALEGLKVLIARKCPFCPHLRVSGRAFRQHVDVNHGDQKSALPSPYPPAATVPAQTLLTNKMTRLFPVIHPRQEDGRGTVERLVHDAIRCNLIPGHVISAGQAARAVNGFTSETRADAILEDNALSLADAVRMIKVHEGDPTSRCHNLCRSYMRTAWHEIAKTKAFVGRHQIQHGSCDLAVDEGTRRKYLGFIVQLVHFLCTAAMLPDSPSETGVDGYSGGDDDDDGQDGDVVLGSPTGRLPAGILRRLRVAIFGDPSKSKKKDDHIALHDTFVTSSLRASTTRLPCRSLSRTVQS
jgi:hypothetical protein